MYDAATIELLEARIGFGSDAGIPIDVSDQLKDGNIERSYDYFHKLVTLVNLYATVDKPNTNQAEFEDYLNRMVHNSVRGSLVKVIDQSVKSDPSVDYSQTIQDNPEIFDEVIGYNMAITALEMMVSSPRVNDEKRNANATYTKLKVELEGLTDENGNLKATGLNSKYATAVRKARRKLFPRKPHVTSKKVW